MKEHGSTTLVGTQVCVSSSFRQFLVFLSKFDIILTIIHERQHPSRMRPDHRSGLNSRGGREGERLYIPYPRLYPTPTPLRSVKNVVFNLEPHPVVNLHQQILERAFRLNCYFHAVFG